MSQYPPPSYDQTQNPNTGYGYGAVPPNMGYGAQPMGYGAQPMGYGAQPMGYGVAPGYPVQPVNYEQMMNYRNQLMLQRRQYQEKQLRENYPVKYAVVHSAILIAFGLATIGIQIAMIVYQTELYYVGSGIWVGAYYFLLAGLVLLIIKVRNLCLLTITTILHMFGFMLSFGGLLAVNVIAYTTSSYSSSSSSSYFGSSFYSYYTTTVVTTTPSNAVKYSGLHIPMLVIGPIAAITCIVFLVSINCQLMGTCGNRNQQVANYNSNTVFQPNDSRATIPGTIPNTNTNPLF